MNPSALGGGVKPDLISVLGPLKKQEGGGWFKGRQLKKKEKNLSKEKHIFLQ